MEAHVNIASIRPTLLHLPPLLVVQKDADGNDRPETGMPFSLMPGERDKPKVTPVPKAVWERVSKHRVVKEWLRVGWIREATADDRQASAGPVDIRGLGLASAAACVEVEESMATLEGWLKTEDREPIKKAIRDRKDVLAANARQPQVTAKK